MQKHSDPRYFVRSLAKGLEVLQALASAAEPRSLSDLAQKTGLTVSSVHRLLHTLETLGYVEKDPEARRYRLAPKVLGLGFAYFRSADLWQVAHPYLVEASRRHGETFNLAVLDGTDILYIDRVKTRRILSINLEIGSKLPAYCTSMGRVLLAHLPEDEARKILARSRRERFTERTETDPERVMGILRQVRARGFALNDGELAVELRSVAAPVRNALGRVVAAVNMAVHASEYSRQDAEERLGPIVKGVADRISEALGFQPSGEGRVTPEQG